jgi:hypothetical protein
VDADPPDGAAGVADDGGGHRQGDGAVGADAGQVESEAAVSRAVTRLTCANRSTVTNYSCRNRHRYHAPPRPPASQHPRMTRALSIPLPKVHRRARKGQSDAMDISRWKRD